MDDDSDKSIQNVYKFISNLGKVLPSPQDIIGVINRLDVSQHTIAFILFRKVIPTQNEVVPSYHRVHWLYFPAVIFTAVILLSN